MSAMTIDGRDLVVALDRNERWFGLLRELRVPVEAIAAVDIVPDGRRAVRGIRALGLAGPRRLIGTWRAKNDKQYVCVRRDQPAVRVILDGQDYRTVLINLDDADRVAAQIRSTAGL